MRIKNGRSTIKEVASAARVSIQTVSRVINERPDVSPETRRRVKEVIDRLGYQPNALARSLIRQRSYTLGVVTAGLKYIGPSRTLSGITAAAEEAGYALLLKELPSFDAENIKHIFQSLLSRQVDAIIWAVPEVGENRRWVNHLNVAAQVPVVYLTMEPRENISVVSVNNYLGGRMAMSHLLGQGYRNIGHISGPLDWWEARSRMAAWKDALTETGFEILQTHWARGNWSSSSGAQAAEILFHQYPEMDAIFVANDQMALGVSRVANQSNLKIPDDLGLVGFDNIPDTANFWPPLTTIQQDQYQLGKIAVEEILNNMDTNWQEQEKLEPKSIMLTPKIIVRQSSLRNISKKQIDQQNLNTAGDIIKN
jgi:LacI family transcriptional regulator